MNLLYNFETKKVEVSDFGLQSHGAFHVMDGKGGFYYDSWSENSYRSAEKDFVKSLHKFVNFNDKENQFTREQRVEIAKKLFDGFSWGMSNGYSS